MPKSVKTIKDALFEYFMAISGGKPGFGPTSFQLVHDVRFAAVPICSSVEAQENKTVPLCRSDYVITRVKPPAGMGAVGLQCFVVQMSIRCVMLCCHERGG